MFSTGFSPVKATEHEFPTHNQNTQQDKKIPNIYSNKYSNLTNQTKKLKIIIPYEKRLENYNKVMAEIFNDFISQVSKKVAKARQTYKHRTQEKNEIASACLEVENDIRPYWNVKINGSEFVGLMDSGASVSCLCKDCLENAKR